VDDEVEPAAERVGRSAAREGPEESFREFVAARWPALLRTAYLLTGDHARAEDLVQSALVRVHRHWARVQAASPDAYVRKVMVNLNTDWWRRLGSREQAAGLAAEVDRPTSADAYASFELREELWAALRELPARMRATLVLRYFEDLTEAETARILGCSLGTVKSQTSRGLARLEHLLGEAANPVAKKANAPIRHPVRSAP
jgi:RNA polymerase sigma-70 factor (sigma-E family)